VNDQQLKAARLLGRGRTVAAAAAEVGVSAPTITRWKRLDEFKLAVQRARAEQLSDPTVRATLEAALVATKRNGVPDWHARLTACRLLMVEPPEQVEPEPVVIHVFERNGDSDH
jgi:transposase-like protein